MTARVLLVAFALAPAGCKKPASSAPAAGGGPSVADAVAAPSLAALQAHDARMAIMEKELADILTGVTDEASAAAAPPKVRALTPAYAVAGRTRLQLIAVLDNPPTKRELDDYLEKQQTDHEKTPSPLMAAVEKAAKGPFAVPLRGAIDAVLDATLEQLPIRQKQWAEDHYRKQGWRK